MNQFARVALSLLAGFAFGACATSPTLLPEPSPTVLTQAGGYSTVAWVSGLGLVFDGEHFMRHGSESRLYASPFDGTAPRELVNLIDPSDGCWRQVQHAPVALSDGRLGYTQECNGDGPPWHVVWSLRAYDPKTGQVESWLQFEDDMLRTFTWDGESTAYVSTGAGLCGGIGVVSNGEITPLTGSVEHDGQSLNLADAFTSIEQPDCTVVGLADNPVLSSDRSTLAFLVSFAGHGFSRDPWNIFLRDVDTGETRHLAGGFGDPTDLDWSPDGNWLMLAGKVDDQRGLWLVDSSSGNVMRFSSVDALRFAWSPDALQIAVIHYLPGDDFPTRLVLFDAATDLD